MFFRPRHLVFPVDTPCALILDAQGPVLAGDGSEYSLKDRKSVV